MKPEKQLKGLSTSQRNAVNALKKRRIEPLEHEIFNIRNHIKQTESIPIGLFDVWKSGMLAHLTDTLNLLLEIRTCYENKKSYKHLI